MNSELTSEIHIYIIDESIRQKLSWVRESWEVTFFSWFSHSKALGEMEASRGNNHTSTSTSLLNLAEHETSNQGRQMAETKIKPKQ